MKKGKKQGIEEEIQKGIEEGRECEKINVAKKMLESGLDLETISKVTALSIKGIEKLKR